MSSQLSTFSCLWLKCQLLVPRNILISPSFGSHLKVKYLVWSGMGNVPPQGKSSDLTIAWVTLGRCWSSSRTARGSRQQEVPAVGWTTVHHSTWVCASAWLAGTWMVRLTWCMGRGRGAGGLYSTGKSRSPSLPRLFPVADERVEMGLVFWSLPGSKKAGLATFIYSSACSFIYWGAEQAWPYSGISVKLDINFLLNAL